MFSMVLSFDSSFTSDICSFSHVNNNNHIHYLSYIWCVDQFYHTFSVVLSFHPSSTRNILSLSNIENNNNNNYYYWYHIWCGNWINGTFSLDPSIDTPFVPHSDPSVGPSDDSLMGSCYGLGSCWNVGELWWCCLGTFSSSSFSLFSFTDGLWSLSHIYSNNNNDFVITFDEAIGYMECFLQIHPLQIYPLVWSLVQVLVQIWFTCFMKFRSNP